MHLHKSENLEIFSRPIASFLILAIPLIYFFPAVVGQVLLVPGDGWTQNYPLRVLAGQMVAGGDLPLWNPYILAGMPLLATVYPGVMYPPNWLFAFLPSAVAMNMVVVTTYHLAMLGTYRLGRSWGWPRHIALFSAITFSFGAFMVAHLGHTSRIAAAAWLPWMIMVVEKLAQSITVQWCVIGALIAGLQLLAGEPQMWLYTLTLSLAYLAWCGWRLHDLRRIKSLMLAFVAIYTLGVLLGSIQWLPAFELIRHGERAAMTFESFSSYAFPLRQLPALWIPFFAGGASAGPYRSPYVYWGEWNAAVTCGYVGMLAWVLLFALLIGLRKIDSPKERSFVIFWLIVMLSSLLLAMGNNIPVIQWVLFYLPIYNLFRGPYRHQLEFTFALSVLAGYGWLLLSSPISLPARKILGKALIVLTAIMTGGCLAYVVFMPKLLKLKTVTAFTDANILIPLTCWLGCLLCSWLFWGRRSTPTSLTTCLLLSLVILDLSSYGYFFYWRDFPYERQSKGEDTVITKAIKARESSLGEFRVATVFDQSRQLEEVTDIELLNYPNASVLRGLQSVNGYDVLRLTRLTDVIGEDNFGLSKSVASSEAHRGLDILNTKYLIAPRATSETGTLSLNPRWHPLATFESVTLYENRHVLPRAWFVSEARNVPSAEALNAIRSGKLADGSDFDPRQLLLFSRKEIPLLPHANTHVIAGASQGEVRVLDYRPARIRLQTTLAHERWLVLSEIDYPGWEAWIDGAKVPHYRADYLLRSVAVPPGIHQVEFRYRPLSFAAGCVLSFVSLVALLAITLNDTWQRRNPSGRGLVSMLCSADGQTTDTVESKIK